MRLTNGCKMGRGEGGGGKEDNGARVGGKFLIVCQSPINLPPLFALHDTLHRGSKRRTTITKHQQEQTLFKDFRRGDYRDQTQCTYVAPSYPANIGDLSDTLKVSLRYFGIKSLF